MRLVTCASRPRARELGIQPGLLAPGPLNAITDVAGVSVGHYTRRDRAEPGHDGRGPYNTGVTVVVPHPGDLYTDRVPAAMEVLNGSGEVAGREFIDEMGVLDGPIALTGSFNVPRVADALISLTIERHPEVGRRDRYVHPCVAECADSLLSDLAARPLGYEETAAALTGARRGPVAEGSVGSGTGLVSFGFKGGIGTSSRRVTAAGDEWVVGVLVSTNTGVREQLRVDGRHVGPLLSSPQIDAPQGSIVMVVATDAPLLSRQLRRLARRAHLGLARTGATAHNGSGDFSIAFSTRNRHGLSTRSTRSSSSRTTRCRSCSTEWPRQPRRRS